MHCIKIKAFVLSFFLFSLSLFSIFMRYSGKGVHHTYHTVYISVYLVKSILCHWTMIVQLVYIYIYITSHSECRSIQTPSSLPFFFLPISFLRKRYAMVLQCSAVLHNKCTSKITRVCKSDMQPTNNPLNRSHGKFTVRKWKEKKGKGTPSTTTSLHTFVKYWYQDIPFNPTSSLSIFYPYVWWCWWLNGVESCTESRGWKALSIVHPVLFKG